MTALCDLSIIQRMSSLFWNDSAGVEGKQLIEFENGTLKVVDGGSNVLKKLAKTKKINLMFIFGNARSGKSFMMNCLAGVRGLFKVVNSSVPCTKGAPSAQSSVIYF